ncbi:MAG: GumC family protein, partial [bacterium]
MNNFEPGALNNPERPEDQDFDFRNFLRIVLKHHKLMAGVFAAVVGLALAYCLTAKRTWEGTVSVKLPDATSDSGGAALQAIMSLSSASDPIQTYMEIAQSYNVGMRAARAVDLTASAQFASAKSLYAAVGGLLKGAVTVTNTKDSNILVFHVEVQDPNLAARLANAWAQAFIAANLDFERTGASSRRAFIETQMAQVKDNLTKGEEALKRLAQRQG